MNNLLIAFDLTENAGLSTGIGGTIAFFARKINTKFLAASLGFSARVIIYVSFVEIFAKARAPLSSVWYYYIPVTQQPYLPCWGI